MNNNWFKHLKIVLKHKHEVLKACFKVRLYWQGIVHDLSKFSYTEFSESVKFYTGTRSPIDAAKESQGYSAAWQHHKGRNPYHYEYWIDKLDDGGVPLIMPYKYVMEMICDTIAAGRVYEKDTWTKQRPNEWWNKKKQTAKIHPIIVKFCDMIYEDFAVLGYAALRKEYSLFLYTILLKQENKNN